MNLDDAKAATRLIHAFDFNEPDNYDALPRSWVRFPGGQNANPQFPRFTEARFDEDIGHDAPPSFFLSTSGRSIAFRYVGAATRVRPGEYVVTGWLRPDRLVYARAAISAYYLDWRGRYLPGSQRFSELIGGATGVAGWRRLVVKLPPAPPEAHHVGLTCWVVQQDVWRPVLPHRHIAHRDLDGGAWFDDLVLVGLPSITLATEQPGGVVTLPERLRVRAGVIDETPDGLAARLTIKDHRGTTMLTRDLPVTRFEDVAGQIPAIDLDLDEPGFYTARLLVSAGNQHIHEERLNMAVLRPSPRPPTAIARNFGVILDQARPGSTVDQIAMLTALGIGSVRLPLWSDDPRFPGFESAMPALAALLEPLLSRRLVMIGELGRPPAALRRPMAATPQTLVDVLSEPTRVWRAALHKIVVPYATLFRAWQIGNEWDRLVVDDPRLADVMAEVRTEMSAMLTQPTLAAVASASRTPARVSDVERILTVALPADIRPDQFADHLGPYLALGYEQVWVTLPALDWNYRPDAVLRDWVQRILAARWAGADVIFVPIPWQAAYSAGVPSVQPTDAFCALRTLADTLGEARPAHEFRIGADGIGLAFDEQNESVVVLSDPSAPPAGRQHTLQLGQAQEAFDLWGRTVPLSRSEDGRHQVHLGAAPIFVRGVERWLMAFRAGLVLSPAQVGFSQQGHRHTLTVTNPADRAVAGEIRFALPDGWEVDPRRVQFTLYPGEARQFDLVIRHPLDTTAGTRFVNADVRLQSGAGYRLTVPLPITVELDDVDVTGYAVTEGSDLVLRHVVTNRSAEALSFRSAAVVPGRSRQYRAINELLPGQMLTTEYRFRDAADQAGRTLRLGLDEVNGPRSHRLAVRAP